ncbi:hypothetical protein PLESTB_000839500 [Pleodorina starrii]|uniref:Uncharacterized protein n=1 Tax=Pleodorina starrii TaxID=330485 RepID=A0A9W6BLR8_9CHLO|nr:hypothetical protein PLESTM_000155300 [Pleodorina starrii]GLC54248.1 hypothetical protein PLESTB_000839500 [Pleodorina starrii]GLC64450.1 hypothetical protein PLESTF_000167300 [Pleodorina starrii]
MAKGSTMAAAVLALLGIAPWAVYVGGLAKMTDVLTGFHWDRALEQIEIMLEWYIVSAQFVNLIIIAVVGFAGGLHRAHSLLNMFLAVNATLLILRATERVQQITSVADGQPLFADTTIKALVALDGNPLPYLRAIAAGQIASATWNFFLAIAVGYGGTDTLPMQSDAPPKGATMA